MKRAIVFCFFAWVGLLKAQESGCNGYFAYKAGTKVEVTHYDKKDKMSLLVKYEVVQNKATAQGTEISFVSEFYDKKGKPFNKSNYTALCKNTEVYVDIRNIVASAFPQGNDFEITISGDQIVYPHNLSKGQRLNDATSEAKCFLKSSGVTIMQMVMTITNRVVEGFETIETPAGKFECVKISYDFDMKMGLIKQKGKTIEYLSKGVGLVKSEVFNTEGERQSWQQITKIEK